MSGLKEDTIMRDKTILSEFTALLGCVPILYDDLNGFLIARKVIK